MGETSAAVREHIEAENRHDMDAMLADYTGTPGGAYLGLEPTGRAFSLRIAGRVTDELTLYDNPDSHERRKRAPA